jgi:hypothetical protein
MEKEMRAFLIACFAVGIVAVSAAVVLDRFVQQSSAAAFTDLSAKTGGLLKKNPVWQ